MPNNSEVVPVVGAEVLHEEMTPVQLEHKAVCTPHKFNPCAASFMPAAPVSAPKVSIGGSATKKRETPAPHSGRKGHQHKNNLKGKKSTKTTKPVGHKTQQPINTPYEYPYMYPYAYSYAYPYAYYGFQWQGLDTEHPWWWVEELDGEQLFDTTKTKMPADVATQSLELPYGYPNEYWGPYTYPCRYSYPYPEYLPYEMSASPQMFVETPAPEAEEPPSPVESVTPPWAEFAIDRPAPYLGHPAYGAMFTRQVYIDAGMVVDLNKAMKAARPIPGRKLFEPGTPYGITTGAMIDNSMSTPVCNNDLPKLGGDPLPYDCDVYYLEIPEIIPKVVKPDCDLTHEDRLEQMYINLEKRYPRFPMCPLTKANCKAFFGPELTRYRAIPRRLNKFGPIARPLSLSHCRFGPIARPVKLGNRTPLETGATTSKETSG